jgi:hypothetical protein
VTIGSIDGNNVVQCITAIAVTVGIVLGRRDRAEQKKENRKAENARAVVAQKVEEVAEVLEDNTEKTTEIHRQTNGATSLLLQTIAVQARTIATLSPSHEQTAIADAAEQRWRDHEKAQSARKEK